MGSSTTGTRVWMDEWMNSYRWDGRYIKSRWSFFSGGNYWSSIFPMFIMGTRYFRRYFFFFFFPALLLFGVLCCLAITGGKVQGPNCVRHGYELFSVLFLFLCSTFVWRFVLSCNIGGKGTSTESNGWDGFIRTTRKDGWAVTRGRDGIWKTGGVFGREWYISYGHHCTRYFAIVLFSLLSPFV
ncbi:hypothetical protein QBC44DRAFT_566 [Cladorrhinum sp. PSN332]|nr:hypothetical protein QBC44DRAFT_566 [Cladorrhinum sp. PSN332]